MNIFSKPIIALGLAALVAGCTEYSEVTTPPVTASAKHSSV